MTFVHSIVRALRLAALLLAISFAAMTTLTGGPGLGAPALAQTGVETPMEEPSPGSGKVPGRSIGNASDAEIWRAVRHGLQGNVSLPDKQAGLLVQSEGEEWRSIRNGPVTKFGGWLLLGMVGVAALYFALRGRIPIKDGRSGIRVPRFTQTQRVVHWFTASLYVLLGLSGLIMLYGKHVLIPLFGPEVFGAIASAAMQGHNLFGPLFAFAIVALFFVFLEHNRFRWADVKWWLSLGGFVGGHPKCGFYNGGEKVWYWMAVALGLTIAVSGLLLDFPFILAAPQKLQIAHLVHNIAGVAIIAGGVGHIYLGTVGMDGALEAMTRGDVDANWAKEHHDLWYQETIAAQQTARQTVAQGAAAEVTT
ncbi:MAG: formate dehydrogenase subunit gamma [Rhodospirillales bacterium]|nr:formate dehydrogenase subunit gamma [Rhodospirillales bacterium]MDH3792625.1 formate dehydrogenase subunit gamma [Rhodospirillales bacterium]MDH3910125.1 formate dehydrogenase subunit gamma [Rhodospirillales bacterium]MDH3916824.1 formate dehydrogenase subunit gamma [Rhodospirillales bacterium]MDH3965917.1 formate dehydrogenase subunit gamma [Rhodospirillales bacterium]